MGIFPTIFQSFYMFSAVFDPFLRSYIDKFKYQSVTTAQWKAYLYEYFADKVSNEHAISLGFTSCTKISVKFFPF